MPNNIKKFRTLRGLSLQKLADMIGTSNQMIHLLENEKRKLTIDWLNKLASALRVEITDLLNVNTEKKLIPLVGYVGAGTTMRCNNMTEEPMDWIDPITVGLNQNFPPGTMFIQVKGNSMVGSADDGDYLWLNSNDVFYGVDIEKMLNKRAVVICKDGFNFYKKIKRSNKKGTYNLHSINTPEIMEDIHIQCAYIVHGVVYR